MEWTKCTYINYNPLTKIVIVWYWFKMSMASTKTMSRPPFFVLAAQLG